MPKPLTVAQTDMLDFMAVVGRVTRFSVYKRTADALVRRGLATNTEGGYLLTDAGRAVQQRPKLRLTTSVPTGKVSS